jgi:hypothetical protein
MQRWQPCKTLLLEENANVALSGLNNMGSSQAKGPQQESAVKKSLLQLCINIPQHLALKNPCRHSIWIICLGVWHSIMPLVQYIPSLLKYCPPPPKKGGVINEIYDIFPSRTSQISLSCTINVEKHKLVYYSKLCENMLSGCVIM